MITRMRARKTNTVFTFDRAKIAQPRLASDSARNLGVRLDCSQTSLTFPSRTVTLAITLRPSSATFHENFVSSLPSFELDRKENLPYRSPRNRFKASSATL